MRQLCQAMSGYVKECIEAKHLAESQMLRAVREGTRKSTRCAKKEPEKAKKTPMETPKEQRRNKRGTRGPSRATLSSQVEDIHHINQIYHVTKSPGSKGQRNAGICCCRRKLVEGHPEEHSQNMIGFKLKSMRNRAASSAAHPRCQRYAEVIPRHM